MLRATDRRTWTVNGRAPLRTCFMRRPTDGRDGSADSRTGSFGAFGGGAAAAAGASSGRAALGWLRPRRHAAER